MSVAGLARGEREQLPDRRMSMQLDFVHGGAIPHKYTATLGVHGDGTVAEIFLNTGKEGSLAQTLAHDAAILLSLLLQYGAPFDVIRGAVTRNPDGTAAGPLGHLLDQLAGMAAETEGA